MIDVPLGSTLELDEETVQGVLAACRQEIGTMFGYQAENRGVGITGGVDFVELDGPTVVLHLKGPTPKWKVSNAQINKISPGLSPCQSFIKQLRNRLCNKYGRFSCQKDQTQ